MYTFWKSKKSEHGVRREVAEVQAVNVKSIIISAQQSFKARNEGIQPYVYLASRFKEEHDLVFKITDFDKKSMFHFEVREDEEAYRVTYKA